MQALHVDEEWFCRDAWRRIAARSNRRTSSMRTPCIRRRACAAATFPSSSICPGRPHPRYAGDLRQADALVADGWAAANLPAMLGRPIQRVNKGVDAELFGPMVPIAALRSVWKRSTWCCRWRVSSR